MFNNQKRIVSLSDVPKNLWIMNAIAMYSNKGEYFNPESVINRSELSPSTIKECLEDTSWIDWAVENDYLDEWEGFGHKLGPNGIQIRDAGGVVNWLQHNEDERWVLGQEKREQDELRRLDLIIKTDQVRFLWIDRILRWLPFFKK